MRTVYVPQSMYEALEFEAKQKAIRLERAGISHPQVRSEHTTVIYPHYDGSLVTVKPIADEEFFQNQVEFE